MQNDQRKRKPRLSSRHFNCIQCCAIHNHKGLHASRALREPFTPLIVPPPISPAVGLNRHHLPKIRKTDTFFLLAVKLKHKDHNQLFECSPFTFYPTFYPSFPPVFPSHLDLISLGPVPRNNCWLALLARQELEDKLPNTSWEEIETDGGWRGYGVWGVVVVEKCFRGGRIVPKGVEVKHTGALICNSNEACLQWITQRRTLA